MTLRDNITPDTISKIATLDSLNSAFVLYHSIHNELPNGLSSVEIDQEGILEFLKTKFPINEGDVFSIYKIGITEKDKPLHFFISVPTEKLLFCISHDQAVLFYPFDLDIKIAKNYIYEIEEKFNTTAKKGPELCLITQSDMHLEMTKLNIDKITLDISQNYNDDFFEANKKIVSELNKKNNKGLVLLHGKPGTGKTSYLRYLIHEIKEKKIIFISPDVAAQIGQPIFLNFILKHLNSILIIEDAEMILKNREHGGVNEIISTLLNLSDGLLSDCLHLQVICTFNTEVKNIDKAVLREGRLICSYEFGPLHFDKTNVLLKSLQGQGINSEKEMTLAEIYNFMNQPVMNSRNSNKIGY